MKYQALSNEWKFYKQDGIIGDNMDDNSPVITHSWTIGNTYDISVVDDNEIGKFSISFDSDEGRIEDLNVLLANKDLFYHVFDLDITECINHAIEWQHKHSL